MTKGRANNQRFYPLGLTQQEESGNASNFFKWLGYTLGISKKATGNCAAGRNWPSGAPASSIGAGISKAGGAVIGPLIQVAKGGPEIYNAVDKIAGQKQMLKAMHDYCDDSDNENTNKKLNDMEKEGPDGIWRK